MLTRRIRGVQALTAIESATLHRGILLLLFLLGFLAFFKPWLHGRDPIGYYSWVRSLVIDGDLNTADEYARLGMGDIGVTTVTGHRSNPYAIGSPLLWLPFFLAAHTITLAQGQVRADGYTELYILFTSLATPLYALAGILLTQRALQKTFAWPLATLSVAAVWLASPLVFYMYSNPIMAHANDFFAYALFLTVWLWVRENRKWQNYLGLGLAAAFMALVRNQNAIFVAFPLAELAWDAWRDRERWRVYARRGLAFCSAWWIGFLPQLVVWKIVFGTWLQSNPYAYGYSGHFDLRAPFVLPVLLSSNRGLFIWTPFLFLAVIGWGFLYRRDRRLALLLGATFVLQLYVIGSWTAWHGSASFGQRFFTNLMPAFAFGLAALLDRLQARLAFKWLVAACAAFVVWNILLLTQYVLELVPRAGAVDMVVLVKNQFWVIPANLSRLIDILLTRQ
ncbi:MAG: hypothetical protein ACE5H9_13030 [Anaerolineae bacterium]